ncbi:MAG: histidine--tRNA ligase [Propioniciclava sp.]
MRPTPLSGFPEFLPAGRIAEQAVLDSLRQSFELHGFTSVETRAVETLEALTRKGEIDKEVYGVRRVHAPEGSRDELGLHFDLTVPFARYVLEHAGHLLFPFRRYQIQKVWRGERPQEGRYREFVQADIDIVGENTLAAHHDIEVALVMLEALTTLHTEFGIPPVTMHVNNRKLAEGFYLGLGIDQPTAVLQRIDKLDKIGRDPVQTLLTSELGLTEPVAHLCLELATIQTSDTSFVERVRALGVVHPLLDEGLAALAEVVTATSAVVPGRIIADLKIARGLDYYTGTVYETEMAGFESLGSICSGGRYDALATDGKRTYPGVGISVGVTRILGPLINRGALTAARAVPTCVLVAVDSEESRAEAMRVAALLRGRGIPTEVAPKADKFGKQIRYADRRGIPFVWFSDGSVKDIRSGEQVAASAASWQPPEGDLRPTVRTTPTA